MDGSADHVPVCIICGYLNGSFVLQLVTNLSQVSYLDDNGVPLVNNTNNVVITDNGLILNDPAGSFTDGEAVQCIFNDGIESGTYAINIDIFCKLDSVKSILQFCLIIIILLNPQFSTLPP